MTTNFAEIENRICISTTAVIPAIHHNEKAAENVVKVGLYRNRKGNDSWQHYEDKADSRKRWIVIDSIPELTRQRIEAYYGDTRLAFYTEQMLSAALLRIQPDDKAHFLAMRAISEAKCVQLAEACGWMRLVISDWWRGKYKGKTVYYRWAVQAISTRNLYGLRVSNPSSLRRKVQAWNKEGRDSLVPGYIGNTNAAKVSEEEINRLIDLYASPLKLTHGQVKKVYDQEAKQNGWATLSEERIRQILEEPQHKMIWSSSRHGVEASRNLSEATLRRKRPSFPDALWSLDGTTVQLYYQEKDRAMLSNLYIYAAIDAYSDAVVGYAIEEGRGETATIVQACLRDATRKTGMRPFQLQYDNSSANKSGEVQQLMSKLARVGFPTAPYNGKAKPIERIFGAIEQRNMRLMPNFKGGNITGRSLNAKANPDHIAALLKSGELPTKEQAIAQVKLIIETHNHSEWRKNRKTTRAERYQTADPKREAIDYLTQVSLFWVERRKPVRYTKDGLRMQVNGEDYYYAVESERGIEDAQFRATYLGDRFQVRYDPDDLEQINLYKEDKWIATAVQKYEFAMAKVDAPAGEGEILHKALGQRKEEIRAAQRRRALIRKEQEEAGRPVPSHQLVNKEAYNKMEQEYLDELITAAGRVVSPAPITPRKRYSLYNDEDADGSIVE